MKTSISALFLTLMFLLVIASKVWAQPTCVEANGLNWCYNNRACGQACEDLCASIGAVLIDDDNVWFQAQNTLEECQAISQAFGLGSNVQSLNFSYACLEDSNGFHSVGGGLIPPLLCSTEASCPFLHRTNVDAPGVPCGLDSRRSICPCEFLARDIPTLSEWGVIAMAGILGIVGFIVIRRRKVAV